ncbi:MAG: J domain-containing protein, partial [Eggerthellaceae bacterium]|nr:J domain-containing protein [Eggerthellaceae bacterium]
MNRTEALRVLGLDEDATAQDIKVAYKEMAQILHPDRFASSKKLQDRATEQFKNLQEAYDLLASGKAGGAPSGGTSGAQRGRSSGYSAAQEYEARMAGIAAARAQLVAQRDTLLDERRNALIMLGIGVVICLFLRRYPIAVGLGSTAVIWGIVRTASTLSTLKNLNEHIQQLNKEQKKTAQKLADLEG